MNGTKIEQELQAQELGDSGIYFNKEKLREKAENWRKKPSEEKGNDLIKIGVFGILGGVVLVGIGKAIKNSYS
ncbi:MAG: hypothetical protein ABIC91_07300 [Nanoarchaeota archaeon]|nr:hypothetical protein [Nanoarchaeota archaeon]MBU1030171.1 hypothetical protein [Nanoarchaeota archaeon]MBU1849582.1 hypothetical protein [Nanoarchaeota archaeon]